MILCRESEGFKGFIKGSIQPVSLHGCGQDVYVYPTFSFVLSLILSDLPTLYIFTVRNISSCGKVMFSQASVILSKGAHAWHGVGMRGRGTCMAGGHAWQGACMAGGVHGGGMHGRRACAWWGVHAWQGGICGGGMQCRGHAWQGRILLECILVIEN